jgi:hypothetical protein
VYLRVCKRYSLHSVCKFFSLLIGGYRLYGWAKKHDIHYSNLNYLIYLNPNYRQTLARVLGLKTRDYIKQIG